MDVKKDADLSRWVIVMVNNDSSSAVRFTNFSEGLRQANCGIPLTIHRPTMLSGTVATWPVLPKKHAIICFEVLLPRTTFVGFGSSSKTHTVDCCFVSGSYVWWFDPSSPPVTILYTCFEAPQIVRDPTRKNLFYSQMFMQYWMYAGGYSPLWCKR